MTRLTSDETAMRTVIGELVAATDSAERSVAALRDAVADSDRTLATRLRAAEECAADLVEQLRSGEAVLARVGEIAGLSRRAVAAERPAAPAQAGARDGAGILRATVQAARDVAERAAARRAETRAA